MATQYDAPAMLMASFNARAWSGVAVFNRGGANVTLPTYGAIGEGLFRDPLDFLNGRGQSASECLPGAVAAAWTGAGTATCGIDATDRFYIQSSAEDFEVAAGANNSIYGFDPSGHGLVGGAAPFRRTAPNPWRLGPIVNASISIDPAAAAAFPAGGSRYHQDLVTAIRELGSGDSDDRNQANSLQALDAGIYGGSARWLVDETGHVVTAWRTGTMGSVTWLSATFRARLGFSGSEVLATAGGVDYLRADHPLPGVVLLKSGLELHEIETVTLEQVRDLTGGGMASVTTDTHQIRHAAAYLWGPSMGSAHDMHRHYVGSAQVPGFMNYARDGRRWVTLYPRWGDPRRWLDPRAVSISQPAANLLFTAGLDGYRGRVEGSLARASAPSTRISWESNLRQYARVQWAIKEGA